MDISVLKKILKFLPVDILFLTVVLIFSLGWVGYQRRYVCHPAINHAIEEWTKTAFDSRQQVPQFVVQEYDWGALWYSFVQIDLETGERCSVSLNPEKDQVLSCWGHQYEVRGFHCFRK